MKNFYTTKEYRKKLSRARLKRKQKLGYLNSMQAREKMKLAKLGKPSGMKPMLGKVHSFETRGKISNSMKGEKHWNWKGGLTQKTILLRHSFQCKEWRKKVFVRDRYICNQCKKVGGKLNAHHLKSWKKYPNLRYEISNGITLCVECHKKTDNYGKRAFT